MRAIVTVPKFHNLPLGEWPMRDFRFGSLADIQGRPLHVRFTPESGHQSRS
jgi:hypothetical protein